MEKAEEKKNLLINERKHYLQSRLLQRSLQSRQELHRQFQQRQLFMHQILKLLTYMNFEMLVHALMRMRDEFGGVRGKMVVFNFKARVIQRAVRAYLVKMKILGIDAMKAKRAVK